MNDSNLKEFIAAVNAEVDNKIKKIVEGELKGYEEFVKKSEKLLKKQESDKLAEEERMQFEEKEDNTDLPERIEFQIDIAFAADDFGFFG